MPPPAGRAPQPAASWRRRGTAAQSNRRQPRAPGVARWSVRRRTSGRAGRVRREPGSRAGHRRATDILARHGRRAPPGLPPSLGGGPRYSARHAAPGGSQRRGGDRRVPRSLSDGAARAARAARDRCRGRGAPAHARGAGDAGLPLRPGPGDRELRRRLPRHVALARRLHPRLGRAAGSGAPRWHVPSLPESSRT